jgi:uncharacterized protein YkwD
MNTTQLLGLPKLNLWQRSWFHVVDHFVPHARNHYQPHLLHHRVLAGFSVLLLTLKVCSLSAIEFAPSTDAAASAITPASVLELTNQSRSQAGIAGLTYNASLEQAAQAKANDLLARQYFAHNTPDGKTPWYFFDLVGYKYLAAGENLAVHFSDVEPLQDAWMNSPGHRANILNSSFKEMGVGISRGQFEGHDSIFVVEEFGNPATQTTTPVVPTTSLVHPQTALAAPAKVATPPAIAPAAPVPSKVVVQDKALTQATPTTSKAIVPVIPQPIVIDQTKVTANGGELFIQANTSSNVSKLLLTYGAKSKFFRLHADGSWSVSLPVEAANATTLTVEAYDLQGRTAITHLASISPTFAARYGPDTGSVKAASVTLFGQELPVRPLEHKAYLGIIALLLTALIIAIGVHRHLQHIRLVANTAFVVAFATLLLLF